MDIESKVEENRPANTAEVGKNRAGTTEFVPYFSVGKRAGLAVNIVDKNGMVLYTNDQMRLLAGRDITGEFCWSAWGDERDRCEGCPLVAGQEVSQQGVTELPGVYGGKTFRITHARIPYNGEDALLQVLEDITETRKVQLGIAQAQKLESIGTIASGIAHDFNNLLGIIIGNASLIEKSADNHEKVLKRIDIINRAAERGTSLVKQLLTFARNSEPNYTAVSVNRIIGDISKLFDETFPKSMRLLCNLSEDLPMVIGDPSQIHQVLLNLIVNAKDAMKGVGQVIISTKPASAEVVHTLFPSATATEYLLVGISDNGEGMSQKILKRIFEPFFTTKGQLNGTGLGLSVVSDIMEQHHGFIDVKSRPGIGTDFSLYFPAHREATNEPVPAPWIDADTPGGDETIMIVEDEDMLNELLSSILTSKGYRVLRTRNGRQAVETYRDNKERISLVISDLGIPNLTGGEVLTWLKEINPRVKFILSTGYVDTDELEAIRENGASEIILKPYRPIDLLKRIRQVLDQ